jgi:hypothetical protein
VEHVYNLCIQNETKVPEQPGPFGENSSQRSKTIKKKKNPKNLQSGYRGQRN